jgi:hypothetical protein
MRIINDAKLLISSFFILLLQCVFAFQTDSDRPKSNIICHLQLPDAAEIILSEESISLGGTLNVSLIPKNDLSDITISFADQGMPSSNKQIFKVKQMKKSENLNISLKLPENLKRNGRALPRRNESEVPAESKTFLLEVRGYMSDGTPAYSGDIIIFDYLNNELYQALKLNDYIHKYGNKSGFLDELLDDQIKNVSGTPSRAEAVDNYDKIMDKNGNVIRMPENEKLMKESGVQSDVTVQVSGYIYFQDSDGNLHPLGDATVEIYEVDDGVGYHSADWTALTNSNGYYSISVTDNEPDNELEIYLHIKTINSMLSVETPEGEGNGLAVWGDYPYSWTGPTVEHVSAGSTTLNYTINNSTKGAAQLFHWLMQACYFTRTSFDPGTTQAVWPASGTGVDPSYNYNILFQSVYANSNSHDVAYHEYGHLTMYRRNPYHAYGSGGDHSIYDLQLPGLAWSEGWATAYAQFVNNDNYYDAANFDFRVPIENNSEMLQLKPPIPAYNASSNLDNEIRSAAALLDFYDTGEPSGWDDPADHIINFDEMMDIIGNNNIESTIDFYNKMLTSGYLTDLEKDYAYRVMLNNTYPVPFTGGTIFSNTTWEGNYTLNRDVIVPSGVTLTMQAGVDIMCESGVSFTINGILNVNGTTEQPVQISTTGSTSPGSWGAIVFDGSGASSSNVNHLEIYYGTGFRCLNGADAVIQNSYIYHCKYGVYIYNSAPQIINCFIEEPQQNGIYGQASGKSPIIKDNILTSAQPIWYGYKGIWFYSGTVPFISHNDVSGFYEGASFGGNVIAYFSDDNYITPYPNNRFRNNGIGIAADNNCYIWAGTEFGSYCDNSTYGNTTYDVSSTNNSEVYAQLNYWGGGEAVSHQDASSILYTTPIRTTDPWNGLSKMNTGIKSKQSLDFHNISNVTSIDSNQSDLYTGIILEMKGKVDEAIVHYKDMIARNSYEDFALTALYSLMIKYSKNNVVDYFLSLPSSNRHHALILKYTADALINNKFDESMSIYDIIIKDYSEDYQGINAMFEKLFAYINVKRDKEKAEEVLTDIKKMDLKGGEWNLRIEVAEELMGNSVYQKKEDGSNLANKAMNNSLENELFDNYPNPFNPTTVISYSIPNDSKVTLKVFDILGREVTTLVNEVKPAGTYQVNFNGNNLSSGIYIYSLITDKQIITKKMLLIK